jgi:hypothetical protein
MARARRVLGSIVALMRVLSPIFGGPSWNAWRVVLAGLFALPPSSDQDRALWSQLTGRTEWPTAPFSEAWFICGRRAGKTLIAALIAVYLATCRSYKLAPGERGVMMVLAADRRQARVCKRYIAALLHADPALAALIERELDEAIELSNGISIEIHTSSFRAVRGYTVVGAICDEVAFWQADDAANPDAEVLNAIRPAMATIENGLLVCISSPYARRGEVWRAYERHFAKNDAPVLVVQADSRTMNPELPETVVDRAYEDDPARASAEYGAQFRTDIEAFLSRDAISAVVILGRRELPPIGVLAYLAFFDGAGGSGTDSTTLAIAHVETRDGRRFGVLDALREVRPPHSPEQAIADFSALLATYRITRVTGDRFAGEWPREAFARHGISYVVADRPKSDFYRDVLPLINSGSVELLDAPRLLAQLAGLERRVGRSGRDLIDHAPGAHEDLANVAAAALVLAAQQPPVSFTVAAPSTIPTPPRPSSSFPKPRIDSVLNPAVATSFLWGQQW